MFSKKMVQDMLIIDNSEEEIFQRRLMLADGKKIEFTPDPTCVINVFDIETFIKNNTFGKRDDTCRKSE